jgi:hypothetical protein
MLAMPVIISKANKEDMMKIYAKPILAKSAVTLQAVTAGGGITGAPNGGPINGAPNGAQV